MKIVFLQKVTQNNQPKYFANFKQAANYSALNGHLAIKEVKVLERFDKFYFISNFSLTPSIHTNSLVKAGNNIYTCSIVNSSDNSMDDSDFHKIIFDFYSITLETLINSNESVKDESDELPSYLLNKDYYEKSVVYLDKNKKIYDIGEEITVEARPVKQQVEPETSTAIQRKNNLFDEINRKKQELAKLEEDVKATSSCTYSGYSSF